MKNKRLKVDLHGWPSNYEEAGHIKRGRLLPRKKKNRANKKASLAAYGSRNYRVLTWIIRTTKAAYLRLRLDSRKHK